LKSCRFLISGRVQGVFFRETTRRKAQSLNLCGHAVNLPDGRVEVIASGAESELIELERWLWQGSPMSSVSNVDLEWIEISSPEGFTTG